MFVNRSKFLTLLLVILMVCVAGARANAGQCLPASFDDIWQKSELIIKGVVVERAPIPAKLSTSVCVSYSEENPTCGNKIATLKVRKQWKGEEEVGKVVKVYAGDACNCLDSYLSVGQEYIVSANYNDGNAPDDAVYIARSVCDGTVGVTASTVGAFEKELDARIFASE